MPANLNTQLNVTTNINYTSPVTSDTLVPVEESFTLLAGKKFIEEESTPLERKIYDILLLVDGFDHVCKGDRKERVADLEKMGSDNLSKILITAHQLINKLRSDNEITREDLISLDNAERFFNERFEDKMGYTSHQQTNLKLNVDEIDLGYLESLEKDEPVFSESSSFARALTITLMAYSGINALFANRSFTAAATKITTAVKQVVSDLSRPVADKKFGETLSQPGLPFGQTLRPAPVSNEPSTASMIKPVILDMGKAVPTSPIPTNTLPKPAMTPIIQEVSANPAKTLPSVHELAIGKINYYGVRVPQIPTSATLTKVKPQHELLYQNFIKATSGPQPVSKPTPKVPVTTAIHDGIENMKKVSGIGTVDINFKELKAERQRAQTEARVNNLRDILGIS